MIEFLTSRNIAQTINLAHSHVLYYTAIATSPPDRIRPPVGQRYDRILGDQLGTQTRTTQQSTINSTKNSIAQLFYED